MWFVWIGLVWFGFVVIRRLSHTNGYQFMVDNQVEQWPIGPHGGWLSRSLLGMKASGQNWLRISFGRLFCYLCLNKGMGASHGPVLRIAVLIPLSCFSNSLDSDIFHLFNKSLSSSIDTPRHSPNIAVPWVRSRIRTG